jgi:hypothetical protein
MLTDLTTSVTTISPEQLDALFEGTPEGTPSADDLKIGKEEKKVETQTNFDKIDLEAMDKAAEESKNEEVKKEEEKKVEAKTEEKKEDKVVIPDATKAEEEKKDETKTDEVKADPALLKSNVDYLVKKGIFKDFEGREELEMTEEIYAELLEAQVNRAIEERYELKKSSAGEEGKAILDFLENGGDPDVIVDLFKEKKEIAQFDTSTEDAQKELITKYYREVLGWKPDRIKRQLDFLVTQEDAVKNESTDIKEKYDQYFEQQKANLQRQQELYVQQEAQKQKAFESSIRTAIKDYTADDRLRQNLDAALFKVRTLADGTKVNDFYLKFAEWQNDPKKYIELAEFITDHENYLKRKETAAQNKAVEKSFKFLKGNQTLSKTKGSEHTERKDDEEYKGTNFSVIFKQ